MQPLLSPKDQAERESLRSSRAVSTKDLLQIELRLELIILARLSQIERHTTMTVKEALAAFATNVNAAFAKLGTGVDGIAADVQGLKDQIATLQASPGAITAEDQATLDAIQAQASTIADKVSALDDATSTPPTPPVTPTP